MSKETFIEIDYYDKCLSGFTFRTLSVDLNKQGKKKININHISSFEDSPSFSGYTYIELINGSFFWVRKKDFDKINQLKEGE